MLCKDITGKKYGRLTVMNRVDNYKSPSGRQYIMFRCVCDCGNEITVRGDNLKSGNTQSCGCIERERPNRTTHGMSKCRIATIYSGMKGRCYNINNAEYSQYGGRGIKICDEWLKDRTKFYKWAIENGFFEDSTQATCSIDRIDVNGDYSPTNCRFVDAYVQANNTRRNIFYNLNGETHTLGEWSRIVGIKYHTLYNRVHSLNWSLEMALNTPLHS